jgi:hypothetical protein
VFKEGSIIEGGSSKVGTALPISLLVDKSYALKASLTVLLRVFLPVITRELLYNYFE